MSTSCNWEKRVRRVEVAIQSDGRWLSHRVESVPTGNKLPVTGHIEQAHTYVSEYELARYTWDASGNGTRKAKI